MPGGAAIGGDLIEFGAEGIYMAARTSRETLELILKLLEDLILQQHRGRLNENAINKILDNDLRHMQEEWDAQEHEKEDVSKWNVENETVKGFNFTHEMVNGEDILKEANIMYPTDGSLPLPDRIAPMAFQDERLCSAFFPESVKKVGVNAFHNCSALDHVSVPGAEEIEAQAFAGNKKLTRVVLGQGCKKIGYAAFRDCESLEQINSKNDNSPQFHSLEEIDACAFENCKNLKVLHLPENLKYIGPNAFRGCNPDLKLTIPSGCVLESGSLAGLKKENITLPEGMEWDDRWIQENETNRSSLKTIEYDKDFQTGFKKEIDKTKINKVILNDASVIPEDQFKDWKSLTDVSLPGNLEGIEKGVFENCTALKSIRIPHSVTDPKNIHPEAFKGCTNLKKIFVPNSWTPEQIADVEKLFKVQAERYSLKNITGEYTPLGFGTSRDKRDVGFIKLVNPPEGTDRKEWHKISTLTFHGFHNLKEIEMPNTVTSIESGAFKGCENLKSIRISSGVLDWNHMSTAAFQDCPKLKKIFLPTALSYNPEKIKEIQQMLPDCKILFYTPDPMILYQKTITKDIGKKLEPRTSLIGTKEIEQEACAHNNRLTYIDISPELEKMGTGVFRDAANLKTVLLEPQLKTLPTDIFNGCINLERIELPNSLKEIGDRAFQNDKSLKAITIPATVTKIGSNAFYNCKNLKELNLSQVTELGENVFTGCSQLETLDISNVEKLNHEMFSQLTHLKEVRLNKSANYDRSWFPQDCKIIESDPAHLYEARRTPYVMADTFHMDRPESGEMNHVPEYLELKDTNIIYPNAFQDCDTLKSAILPDALKVIGTEAFLNCKNLEELVIPPSVSAGLVGDNIFQGCENLKEVHLPPDWKEINGIEKRLGLAEGVKVSYDAHSRHEIATEKTPLEQAGDTFNKVVMNDELVKVFAESLQTGDGQNLSNADGYANLDLYEKAGVVTNVLEQRYGKQAMSEFTNPNFWKPFDEDKTYPEYFFPPDDPQRPGMGIEAGACAKAAAKFHYSRDEFYKLPAGEACLMLRESDYKGDLPFFKSDDQLVREAALAKEREEKETKSSFFMPNLHKKKEHTEHNRNEAR